MNYLRIIKMKTIFSNKNKKKKIYFDIYVYKNMEIYLICLINFTFFIPWMTSRNVIYLLVKQR